MFSATTLQRNASRLAGGLVRRVHYKLLDRSFDRRHGADTGGALQPDELTIEGDNVGFASEYVPTPTRVFSRLVGSLDIDFALFVFVDLGSGKGRMLLLAAKWPFLRVEGVEFAVELHEVALRNIASLAARGGRVDHIRALHLDAAEYEIPGEPCVFYIYNPFGEPVMRRVLDNVEASYRAHPRPMVILYLNPKLPHLFDERAFLQRTERRWTALMADRLIIPERAIIYRTSE